MEETAKRIVGRIIEDMTSRRGLRQEWEEIDRDIREEITAWWIQLALAEMRVSAESSSL